MSVIPWWIKYPYVNDEIQNLDWLLAQINENTENISDFINLNTIKYADPIEWDITSQYEANTIVVDPQSGDAYISTTAVPYGVSLSNTDYWTKIYNYADAINNLQEQIAIANEELSTTATAARSIGDLVWLNGELYEVIAAMIPGDTYVENSNCIKTTIEEYINTNDTAMRQNIAINAAAIGTLSNLTTTDKDSLVDAINEVDANCDTNSTNIGTLSNLTTTDKDSLVDAINEVDANVDSLAADFADLKNHKIVTIGDSYSLSVDGNSVLLPVGYVSMIGNVTTHVNLATGGSSFYNTSTYPTFLNQLQNAESGTTVTDGSNTIEKEEVTDIIVVGGFNDLPTVWGGTQAQLLSAIASFMTYATTEYPNAKIYVGMIGGSTIATHYVGLAKIIEGYKSCIQYGGMYLNGVENILSWEPSLQVDGIHPSTTGVSLLEIAIAGAFKSGSYQFNLAGLAAAVTFTVNSNVFSSGTITIQQKQHNNLVDTQINPNGLATTLTLASTLTLTVVRTQIDLGTLSNLVVMGNTDGTTNLNINSIMAYDTTTSAWVYLPAQLTLIGSELYLEISSGTAYTINQIIMGSGQTTLFIKNPLV